MAGPTAEADIPQWAKDLFSKFQNLENKLEKLWHKCDEVIDHINCMDERRFDTGRKLWNTISEVSTKTNEKSLIIYGLKLPDPSVGVSTRKKAKPNSGTPVELLNDWFSEKMEISPRILEVQVLQKKGAIHGKGDTPPPIRIELESKDDRKIIYDNVKKLKKLKQKISICDDLPASIRKIRSRMVEKLKQLKKKGEKVRFQGIDLTSNGMFVPPPRPDYVKLSGLREGSEETSAPQSYETDSDEFNTPEKQRKCDSEPEETSPGFEEEAPEWFKNFMGSYRRDIAEVQDMLSGPSDSSSSVTNN